MEKVNEANQNYRSVIRLINESFTYLDHNDIGSLREVITEIRGLLSITDPSKENTTKNFIQKAHPITKKSLDDILLSAQCKLIILSNLFAFEEDGTIANGLTEKQSNAYYFFVEGISDDLEFALNMQNEVPVVLQQQIKNFSKMSPELQDKFIINPSFTMAEVGDFLNDALDLIEHDNSDIQLTFDVVRDLILEMHQKLFPNAWHDLTPKELKSFVQENQKEKIEASHEG